MTPTWGELFDRVRWLCYGWYREQRKAWRRWRLGRRRQSEVAYYRTVGSPLPGQGFGVISSNSSGLVVNNTSIAALGGITISSNALSGQITGNSTDALILAQMANTNPYAKGATGNLP